ncbi:hypothetical protein [Arthrobacter sp.]|uniref:hypothetical protein n=1 Tax=Arthrobacter sp. TaxID=1667 RepID=UPI003A93BFBA
MGLFNKLLNQGKQMAGEYVRGHLAERDGSGQRGGPGHRPTAARPPEPRRAAGSDADAAAIAKYRYMLRTAPPEDMERAHTEAFSRLDPQQREALRSGLGHELPPGERPRSDRPGDLARSATRAEVSHPGFMERLLGGSGRTGERGSGRGFGGLAAGAAGGLGAGLLAGVAGGFIGSAVAGPLLEGFSGIGDSLGEGLDGLAGGLGDSVAEGGEALAGGGLFDGLLGGGGEGFLGGGGEGFFGGGSNDWEL